MTEVTIDGTSAAQDSALLAAIADPVRLAIMRTLSAEGTLCVCDIQDRHPVPGNLMSYHLKILKEAELITSTRRGRWRDYAIHPQGHERLIAALPTTARIPA